MRNEEGFMKNPSPEEIYQAALDILAEAKGGTREYISASEIIDAIESRHKTLLLNNTCFISSLKELQNRGLIHLRALTGANLNSVRSYYLVVYTPQDIVKMRTQNG